MAPPLVTVVIPTYNRAATLGRAIGSVTAQSFRDLEVVVVDDASTDDTAVLVKALADDRVRYVRRQCNGGVAAAQNTGLDHATGSYVSFLHSDDELLPGCLSTLVGSLEVSPEIGGVESGFELVLPDECMFHPPYLEGAAAHDLISYRVGVHISTLLLRREPAAAVRFDEALRGAEDRDFCIRLLRRVHVVTRAEPLVRIYRNQPRLGDQPKGAIYEYLLAKYEDEIAASPELHSAWWFRIARAYVRGREAGKARTAMRRSVAVFPWRARRWPLFLSAFVSDRAFAAALRGYLGVARWADRRRGGAAVLASGA